MPNSKIKASQVRAMLYKLRQTWGDKYHVFTDQKLFQLDNKIKSIDHAWPVVAPRIGALCPCFSNNGPVVWPTAVQPPTLATH